VIHDYDGPAHGDDYPTAIAVDDYGVYVTGSSAGSGTGPDYTTMAGHQSWLARYNGPGNGNDGANAIAVDNTGNIYVTGSSQGNGTGSDYATIKYDGSGQERPGQR
jgi:Beta-propeller repeat